MEALKGMATLKASGIDRYPAFFYQKLWHIIGKDVTHYCLQVLNNGMDFEEVNKTNIVLIPKVQTPTNLGQFRPISLCNVIYKLISKLVVNRFQRVLHLCIEETQSAFVPGRQITSNIMIAYELLHSFKKKKRGGTEYFALKLDMSKAYDRVE